MNNIIGSEIFISILIINKKDLHEMSFCHLAPGAPGHGLNGLNAPVCTPIFNN